MGSRLRGNDEKKKSLRDSRYNNPIARKLECPCAPMMM